MASKPIPVEAFLNVNDPNRWWYYIPGFNGYEISNDGYIRSMKHYKRYPFGMLIRPKDQAGTSDPIFELSNNNNERVTIRLSQLLELARNNTQKRYGYPRRTYVTDIASRNQRAFIKKQIRTSPADNISTYPKFTVTDDNDDLSIQVPIISIDGSEYYGRKDCRAIFI